AAPDRDRVVPRRARPLRRRRARRVELLRRGCLSPVLAQRAVPAVSRPGRRRPARARLGCSPRREGAALMDERPRYMISVAAELVGMHPQTLRIYEAKGLIRPKRTAGNTRLYSEADLERLRLIQQLTNEVGLNLAGVE